MTTLLIYFFAGLAQEFLFTLSFRFIAKEKALAAASISFAATLVAMIIFYSIVVNLNPTDSMLAIITYALGIAVGVFLAVKIKVDKK